MKKIEFIRRIGSGLFFVHCVNDFGIVSFPLVVVFNQHYVVSIRVENAPKKLLT